MYFKKSALFFLFLFLTLFVSGQIFRYKFGVNLNGFIREIGKKESIYPLVNVLSSPASTSFKNKYNFGIESELIRPWTKNLETGLEIEYANYSGYNDYPPYYNFYFTTQAPENIKSDAISYHSSSINFLANLKYFVFPEKKLDPYIKVFAGSSLVSAELKYKNPDVIINNQSQIIFASGTKNSSSSKKAAFQYGLGGGINYNLSDKIAFYFDGNLSVINSNLLDGIPNFNYSLFNGYNFFSASSTKSLVSQFGFGLVFTTFNFDFSIPKKKSSGVKKGGGKTTKYLPFYKEK